MRASRLRVCGMLKIEQIQCQRQMSALTHHDSGFDNALSLRLTEDENKLFRKTVKVYSKPLRLFGILCVEDFVDYRRSVYVVVNIILVSITFMIF